MTGPPDVNRELVERMRRHGVTRSERVLSALEAVPRGMFLPEDKRTEASRDAPVPIGAGQTMSAPHMVAMMAEALDVHEGHRVLEVGGGSGYHAAVLAHLAGADGHVWTIERVPGLARDAEARLARAGLAHRVSVRVGDGARGLPEHAPFDRVSVACAAPRVPPPLLDQLAPGGVLVAPVGARELQELVRVRKDTDGKARAERLGGVRFVPLVGEHGFPG